MRSCLAFSAGFIQNVGNQVKKVGEMKNTFSFWLCNAETVKVSKSHVAEIMKTPDKFGLTQDEIEQLYQDAGETPGREGWARERLIRMAAENGWIRVQYHGAGANQLTIQADDAEKQADVIRHFLADLVNSGRLACEESLVLTSFSSGETVRYDWRRGGVCSYLTGVVEAG